MVFSGTVASDFLRLGTLPDIKKPDFVDFAATDFLTIRDGLLKYIQAVYPLDYNNFAESDLGVMLTELVAYMGSVISMKADMLANENYINTVKNRNNVRKLLQIIGVSMKGPSSSAATARFTQFAGSVPNGDSVVFSADNRVVTISSPEDGLPVTFSLYKVVDGQLVDLDNNTGSLTIAKADSAVSAITSTTLVWENLALLEGSLVVQTGTFDQEESIKTIELTKSPVVEGSVSVRIEGSLFKEVDNLFFASGATDRVFQKTYDDDYAAILIFGDGINGLSPSPGSEYTAIYRVGGGTRGNLVESKINSIITGDPLVGSQIQVRVENITPAVGGNDAESVNHAKRYAPLTFRSQNRLVTGEDFTTFINTYVGPTGNMGKGIAVVRKASYSGNNIDVYVLERATATQMTRATINWKASLLTEMNTKKMLTDEITIVDGLIRTLDLIITIRVDKELLAREGVIKGKVSKIVTLYFHPDNFEFGKELILSDLNRTIFTLNEVRFSTIDNLDENIKVNFNEIIQLNNLTINIVGV